LHDCYDGCDKRGNLTPEEQPIDQKQSRSEQSSYACIIYFTDNDKEAVRPKDEESWSTLIRAGAVRKQKPLNLKQLQSLTF